MQVRADVLKSPYHLLTRYRLEIGIPQDVPAAEMRRGSHFSSWLGHVMFRVKGFRALGSMPNRQLCPKVAPSMSFNKRVLGTS